MKFLLAIFTILFCLTRVTANENKEHGLDFIPNVGQWQDDFNFLVKMKDGGTLFMQDNAFTFLYYEENKVNWLHHNPCFDDSDYSDDEENYCNDKIIGHHAYRATFVGANEAVINSGKENRTYHHNYFLGNDQSKWRSNVPAYSKVEQKDLYTNIDLHTYSHYNSLKYDYIVHPGGNVADIKVLYEGLDNISLDKDGNLKLVTSINSITEFKPYAYQLINGEEKEIKCRYRLDNNIISIQLQEAYNMNLPLIIDPELLASTYTGSTADNWGFTATYDNDGNMYAAGMINGNGNMPSSLGGYDLNFDGIIGGYDAVDILITKFSADGTNLIYYSYLGGDEGELPHSLIVDENNQLIVYGTTSSLNFPSTIGPAFNGGSFASSGGSILYANGSDIFLTKFTADGNNLVNSRYFGGSANDGLNMTRVSSSNYNTEFNYGDYARGNVQIDGSGNIVLASSTFSNDIPLTNGSFQSSAGGNLDGLVAKFSGDLSSHLWSSYYGGNNHDAAFDIKSETSGSYLITGGTQSNNLSGMNGLNSSYQGGTADGFIVRIDNNGNVIQNGTYIGTNQYDQSFFVDSDLDNDIYVYGSTLGQYPATAGIWSQSNASQFIHKLTNDLNSTVYSTTFGKTSSSFPSSVDISPSAFQVDVCENVYCMGWGGASNQSWNNSAGNVSGMFEFGTSTSSIFDSNDDSDFYLMVLQKNALNVHFASRLGERSPANDHLDGGTSRFDPNGYVYHAVCASCGGSDDFPTTPGAYSSNNNSDNCNLAVFKIEFDLAPIRVEIGLENDSSCAPFTVFFENLTNKDFNSNQTIIWDFGDGTSEMNIDDPVHLYNSSGVFEVTLIVIDPTTCNESDTANAFIVVAGNAPVTTDSLTICQGTTVILPNGEVADSAGIYYDTIPGLFCDTLVAITVFVNPSFDTTILQTSCNIADTGTFVTNPMTYLGCDSIITTIIDANVNDTIYVDIGSCFPSDTGVHILTLSDACGNDSLIITRTELYPSDSIYILQGSCFPSDTGLAIDPFINQFNCDSIVYTDTELYPSHADTFYTVGCEPSDTGFFQSNLINIYGCDSIAYNDIAITDLELNDISTVSANCLLEGGGATITALGSASPLEYTITATNGTATTVTDPMNIILEPGTYNLTITDSAGCTIDTSFTVDIIPSEQVIAIPPYAEIFLGDSIELFASPITGDLIWTIVDSSVCDTCPDIIVQPGISTTYTITRIDSLGCSTTDTVLIYVEQPLAFIPNAFTPNGDGVNDVLYIISEKVETLLFFRIYNRWGEMIFETEDIDEGWDGTYENVPQELDTYIYHFKLELILNDVIIEQSAPVFLIR